MKPRKTFAVREVLRVGLMVGNEPYLATKVGGGKSYMLSLLDGDSVFEDAIIKELGLKSKDEVEFVLTVRVTK